MSVRARPGRLNAAIAWSFMVGSALFALGSVPAYASAVGAGPDAVTYFAGSIFFTLASYGQLVASQTPAAFPDAAVRDDERQRLRLFGWRPHDRAWLAAVIQFPGTLAFNVSTFAATVQGLTATETDQQVWRPDAIGSILFLVSSGYALAALGPVWRRWRPRTLPWTIGWLNMAGSVAFGISAVGAFVWPETGTYLNVGWANAGTFVGALCFLAGAWLMLPAWTEARRTVAAPASG